ncbi:MAG: hypothetical protein N2746_07990 [Deltaproteobacteria bacterium]|nr:hypothetical protein [Deltaproteobacteria bacterium]
MKKLIFVFIFLFTHNLYSDDPLDYLTGTEEWDREEEAKKQALILAQKRKMLSDEFYQTRNRVSFLLSEWQRDLSKFQEIRRTISDILFNEEAKSFQQINVKEKLPAKEIKRMPAKDEGFSIEAGSPVIEKTLPKATPQVPQAPPVSTPSTLPSPPPKKEEPPEPTTEEILKKQGGHFDDKGQFIDEELKNESGSKGKRNKDIDYDSP